MQKPDRSAAAAKSRSMTGRPAQQMRAGVVDLDGDTREPHGGDLSLARNCFPSAPQPWLDLSTGVNPYPYPFRAPPSETLTRLPDSAALAALEAAAAAAYGAAPAAHVVAAAGTQAIINWLPHLFPARRVGVLGFTYSEHARSWRASGAAVSVVGDLRALEDMDVAIVVNPNNPDGRIAGRDELQALAGAFRGPGRLLVVDEAFADFLEPGVSLAPELPSAGALVLRSFGKTYGLPGLRLGFAIAPPDIALKLRRALGCWPVPGPAIAIGVEALADKAWLAATRTTLKADAEALDAILDAAGLVSRGGAPLFRLAVGRDAARRFETLAGAGIWVRRFDARPDWLRFAIAANGRDRARLCAALGVQSSLHGD
jgi:cobalamin biosynthetic protein CobC